MDLGLHWFSNGLIAKKKKCSGNRLLFHNKPLPELMLTCCQLDTFEKNLPQSTYAMRWINNKYNDDDDGDDDHDDDDDMTLLLYIY